MPVPYSFDWMAAWIIVAASLLRHDLAGAIRHAEMMLPPISSLSPTRSPASRSHQQHDGADRVEQDLQDHPFPLARICVASLAPLSAPGTWNERDVQIRTSWAFDEAGYGCVSLGSADAATARRCRESLVVGDILASDWNVARMTRVDIPAQEESG